MRLNNLSKGQVAELGKSPRYMTLGVYHLNLPFEASFLKVRQQWWGTKLDKSGREIAIGSSVGGPLGKQ